MNSEDLEKLSEAVDRKVKIVTTEGEHLVAKVLWVDKSHSDLVVDLISTSAPERYAQMGGVNAQQAYLIPFGFISRVDFYADD